MPVPDQVQQHRLRLVGGWWAVAIKCAGPAGPPCGGRSRTRAAPGLLPTPTLRRARAGTSARSTVREGTSSSPAQRAPDKGTSRAVPWAAWPWSRWAAATENPGAWWPDSAAGRRSRGPRTRPPASSPPEAAAYATARHKGGRSITHPRHSGSPACRRWCNRASSGALPCRSRRDGSWPQCTRQRSASQSPHCNSRPGTGT